MALSGTNNITHACRKSLVAINDTQLSLKLSTQNYSTWRARLLLFFEGVEPLAPLNPPLTGTISPPPILVEEEGRSIANPDYKFGECQALLILAAIIALVSFSVMNTIAEAKTSVEAWNKLQVAFSNKSATRILSLREKLSHTKRDSRPVAKYLQLVKSIAEELSLCGGPVNSVDLIAHVLGGIGFEFRDIAAAIHARDTVISFDKLQDKLLAHELYLKQIDHNFDPTPTTANHVRKGNSSRPPYQSRQGNNGKPSTQSNGFHFSKNSSSFGNNASRHQSFVPSSQHRNKAN
uniref:Retrovirus-related Pol polyprotein from transposon TNT 1-94 n=2 Tax=Nicotiana TaxID=4085 RepID=A0A1S4AT09_TOBAC|nr:PREDICTED: uncharacterized protein LOC104216696 [Nicotiana sylvestris]XP_016479700.1 PREDICTED: uncharacterized protein LOC107800944 [Nicotiana tabacum]